MNAAAIVKVGESSKEYENIRKGLEHSLCGYISENFQEILEADKRDVQYSTSIFLRGELEKLCKQEHAGRSVNLTSYMVVAADKDMNQFVSVQWGRGMIVAEGDEKKYIISCPAYREKLKETYSRINGNDLTKICIKKGELCGIKKFRLVENRKLPDDREEVIEC